MPIAKPRREVRRKAAKGFATLVLAMAVVFSPGNTRWGPVSILIAFSVAYLPVFGWAPRFNRCPMFIKLVLLMTGLTFLQLLPLPTQLVELIAPRVFSIKQSSFELLGEGVPAWMQLSLDPHTSFIEAVKFLSYAVTGYCFAQVAARRKGQEFLVVILVAIAGVAAVVGLVHYVLGESMLFGQIPVSGEGSQEFLSFLVNPNHYGLLMAVAACLCAGAFACRRDIGWKVAFGLSGCSFATLALLSKSRGAIVACAFGLLITYLLNRARATEGPLKRRKRRKPASTLNSRIPVISTIVAILLLIFTMAGGNIIGEFSHQPITDEWQSPKGRLTQYKHSLEMVGNFPLTGVGKGAFETAITAYNPRSSVSTFSYAESMPIQWIADWGLFGGGIVICFALFSLWLAIPKKKSTTLHAGAVGALGAVALVSCFDFAFEVTGIGVVTMLVFAVACPPNLVRRNPRERNVSFAFVSALLALAIAAASPFGETLREKHAEFSTAGFRGQSPEVRVEKGEEAARRHPSDYLPFLIVANSLYEQGDARAIQFINRALTLHPTNSQGRFLGARLLFLGDRKAQACGQYKLAAENAPSPTQFMSILNEVVSIYGDGPAIACLPEGRTKPVDIVLRLLARGNNRTAFEALEIRRQAGMPGLASLYLAYATRVFEKGEIGKAQSALLYTDPADLDAQILKAKTLARVGQSQASLKILEALVQEHPQGTKAARIQIATGEILMQQEDWMGAKRKLQEALKFIHTDENLARKIHFHLAKVESALGNRHSSEWELDKARGL